MTLLTGLIYVLLNSTDMVCWLPLSNPQCLSKKKKHLEETRDVRENHNSGGGGQWGEVKREKERETEMCIFLGTISTDSHPHYLLMDSISANFPTC